jgi:hypothetical protein
MYQAMVDRLFHTGLMRFRQAGRHINTNAEMIQPLPDFSSSLQPAHRILRTADAFFLLSTTHCVILRFNVIPRGAVHSCH